MIFISSITFSRLRELRKKHGLTQVQLSKRTGIAQETISSYERGCDTPGLKTTIRLATALDTSVEYLIGLSDHPHPTVELSSLLSTQEIELLNVFKQLSDHERERAIGYIHRSLEI